MPFNEQNNVEEFINNRPTSMNLIIGNDNLKTEKETHPHNIVYEIIATYRQATTHTQTVGGNRMKREIHIILEELKTGCNPVACRKS